MWTLTERIARTRDQSRFEIRDDQGELKALADELPEILIKAEAMSVMDLRLEPAILSEDHRMVLALNWEKLP